MSAAAEPSPIRRLGLLAAIVLVAGNMIGSGVYLLPATLGTVGSISLISWLIASAGAIMLALVFGVLGVLRPKADGVVDYAGQALHPALGHLSWFAYWLNLWVGTSAIAVAAVGYLGFFIPALKAPTPALIATLVAVWLMSLANLIGPRLVARIGGATLVLGLAPIVLATGVGFIAFDSRIFETSWNVSGRPDTVAFTAAVAPVFWAFLGLESANVAAQVIDNPRRNLPIATVGGVVLAAVVYIAASVAIMGLVPARDLAASGAPFADAIRHVAGPLAAALVAFCAFSKASGTLGGWILLTAETGRAGAAAGFLPRFVSGTAGRPRPGRDIAVAAILMTLATLASASPTLGGQFSILINVSVILSMILYLLCALSLAALSREIERPILRLGARIAATLGAAFSLWVIITEDASLRLPTIATVVVSLGLWAASRFTARRRAAGS
ncbi:MAG: amino acid permease [Caulobacteraceae bacterium]|nr:amino acid permease [Caulobacteraceae bacterium]